MYVIDGVGQPALKGANLPQERDAKREFVTWIARGANRAIGSDVNVERGEMIQGELCFFCVN